MKRLSELGISPAPWKCAIDDSGEVIGIENGRGFYVARFAVDVEPADARLIAASPKMYGAAHNLVSAFDRREMTPEHIEALRAALAEAAGEEVGDGK